MTATIPAGCAGTFELVLFEGEEKAPLAGSAVYAVAPPHEPLIATIRWSPDPNHEPQPDTAVWQVELFAAGLTRKASGIRMPEAAARRIGISSLDTSLQRGMVETPWSGAAVDDLQAVALHTSATEHKMRKPVEGMDPVAGIGSYDEAFGLPSSCSIP
jgi:hypothetical protein